MEKIRNMKQILILAAMLLCGMTVSAHDFEVGGIYYNIIPNSDQTVEVTHEGDFYWHNIHYKDVVSMEIPSDVTYEGKVYKVTGIGYYAFHLCSSLASITIPESVTTIGEGAFSGCCGLTSISIPESIISIGKSAFSGCSSLTSITIPKSVLDVGDGAFEYCHGLTSAIITEGVGSIGVQAFNNCEDLVSITIPKSVTSIGRGAFYGITEIIFISTTPPTLTSSSIAYSPSVIVVPAEAYDAYNAAWPDLESLFTVDDENIRIREVTLTALDNGSALSMAIGEDNLKFVTDLTVSGTINSYDFEVFLKKMPLLRHLNLNNASIVYNAYEHNKWQHTEDNVFPQYGLQQLPLLTLILPQSITSIDDNAFWNCNSLREITIPEGVTSIGGCTFWGCGSLTSIEIPRSVTSIGGNAFGECSSLSSVYIKDLGAWCNIKFVNEGSNPLCKKGGGMYIEGQLITELNVPSTIMAVEDYAFYNCDSIRSVVISKGVSRVGNSSFSECNILTSISLPETITDLGVSAFSRCPKLSSVNIPSRIKEVKARTFEYCESLPYVKLPEGLTHIGDYAFCDCMRIDSIIIPESVHSIGESAFAGCRMLSSINIPEGVTEIKYYTFAVCWKLGSIIIPKSVSKIGSDVFYNCSGLQSVVMQENLTEIGSDAFMGCGKLSKIVCHATVPPKVENTIFPSIVYETAQLHVPMASLESYKVANDWSKFFNIIDIETEIIPTTYTSEGESSIYNLHGDRIINTETLDKGIYIVDGKKVMIQ